MKKEAVKHVKSARISQKIFLTRSCAIRVKHSSGVKVLYNAL